jgi:hypothetical protein
MDEEKFVRVNIKENLKREIDTVAGHEQRPVYEIMEDAWRLYKLVAVGKPVRKGKKVESVSVVDVIAH